ncbi:MAG: hypothetical protein ACI8TF_001381 [Paracoccaceae bacterium]|jgi:hypothetical protein
MRPDMCARQGGGRDRRGPGFIRGKHLNHTTIHRYSDAACRFAVMCLQLLNHLGSLPADCLLACLWSRKSHPRHQEPRICLASDFLSISRKCKNYTNSQ